MVPRRWQLCNRLQLKYRIERLNQIQVKRSDDLDDSNITFASGVDLNFIEVFDRANVTQSTERRDTFRKEHIAIAAVIGDAELALILVENLATDFLQAHLTTATGVEDRQRDGPWTVSPTRFALRNLCDLNSKIVGKPFIHGRLEVLKFSQ